jgi:4-amino-4-deoxy-L-arabinose transferase-like glycosyltransferase
VSSADPESVVPDRGAPNDAVAGRVVPGRVVPNRVVPGRVEPGPLASILVPLGLIALAAALRLPDLATRGTWDGDQGHDMLMLRALVRDGVIPLLGPPTSIGDVHHGALYYYLLAPAATLTGGDSPFAVVFLIALAGIAAVAVTWWLARAMAGPVAGLVAGLAMAISPASIDESTFIWNPNLIGLSSAIALAGAWQAWRTRRARWWLLAAVGTAVTMQCHVLGVTLLPIVGALFVADLRRRPSSAERRALARIGLGGLGLIALSFVPLVIHELTTNFAEVQAALAYIRAGGEAETEGPVGRFLIIGTRVVSWPLVGLIVDGVVAAVVSLVAVASIAIWRSIWASGDERLAVRWLGLGLVWTAVALTFLAPSLSTVIRGLPNDHYHAFADPMVFVVVGIGAAALWRAVSRPRAASGVLVGAAPADAPIAARGVTPGRLIAVAGVAALAAWAATHVPPPVHADGGYPAARAAAERIEAGAGPGPIDLRSLPVFKSVEAYAYPLVQGGRDLEPGEEIGQATLRRGDAEPAAPASIVVVCDVLFEVVIGAPCGGPAEATLVPAGAAELLERFNGAPGRVISIYRAAAP